VENNLIYPNPYFSGSGNLLMNITISRPAASLTARIYTVAMRRVLEIPVGSADIRDITITLQKMSLSRLSAGAYYVVVEGESTSNERAVSKPQTLVVLR